MSSRYLSLIIISILLLFAGSSSAQGIDSSLVSSERMMETIATLASKAYGGRLAGSDGQMKAAVLVSKAFGMSGIKPLGDEGGYLQYLTVPYNDIHAEPAPVLEVMIADLLVPFNVGEDYIFRGYTGSGDISAEICFVGYGITEKKLGLDDYAGVDVEGKWALTLRGWQPKYREETFDWAYAGMKARNAKEHGAIGMLMAGVNAKGKITPPIASYLYGIPHEEIDHEFPAVQLAGGPVQTLFGAYGWYLPSIIAMMSEGDSYSFEFPEEARIHVRVSAEYDPERRTANVVGYIEGSDDPEHAIVICAHHDHVGKQAGLLFPGSNDNASGTSALIEIAKVLSESEVKLSKSVIFASFTGEEEGLLGSHYFVDNSPWPLENIDYVINMDMIGQGTNLSVWGGKEYAKMRVLFDRLGREYGLEIEHMPAFPVSDHGPFMEKDIMAIMLLTGGEKDFSKAHMPYIYTPDKINAELLETVTRMTLDAVVELANE